MTVNVDELFYIVIKGTNSRVVGRDGEAVIARGRESALAARDRFGSVLREDVEVMSVRAWFDTFVHPLAVLRRAIKQRAVTEIPIEEEGDVKP